MINLPCNEALIDTKALYEQSRFVYRISHRSDKDVHIDSSKVKSCSCDCNSWREFIKRPPMSL